MKNTIQSLLVLITLFGGYSAYAIDQVLLKNGEVVEGKILNDVPNRHVDIQLPNGTTRRYAQTEVSSVERDVPSRKDTSFYGNTSRVYAGALLGGALFSGVSSDFRFNYGARFGVNAAQLGDFSQFAAGLAFNRSTRSTTLGTDIAYNEILVQLLFRRVGNSGFYFGPEAGLLITSVSNAIGSNSNTNFDIGAVAGYDYMFSPGFSMGPEIQFTAPSNTNSLTITKFLLSFTFHFE